MDMVNKKNYHFRLGIVHCNVEKHLTLFKLHFFEGSFFFSSVKKKIKNRSFTRCSSKRKFLDWCSLRLNDVEHTVNVMAMRIIETRLCRIVPSLNCSNKNSVYNTIDSISILEERLFSTNLNRFRMSENTQLVTYSSQFLMALRISVQNRIGWEMI